ncbi:MAG: TonB-dependent receptor [Bacteroides sp.]|nr:TonB-dependent receptor [Bacteroides sp.]
MNKLLSLILLFFIPLLVSAQTSGTVVRGEMYTSDGKPIVGGEVAFLRSDSIAAAAMTNPKGKFEIRDLPTGDYICQMSAFGYKDKVEPISVNGSKLDLPRVILQKDSASMLGELTVTADQSLRTKDMAGMTVYQLSSRAKQENDAYTALQEIPRLRVNSVEKKIELDNGSSPLILIDGVYKPGYLNVLRPEMIESVEVIDNPPARYRANSTVSSVLNIKLKSRSKINPYLNGNLGANLMPNLKFGVENLNAEVGNSSSSLSITGQHFFMNNVKNESFSQDKTPGQNRNIRDDYKSKMNMFYGAINADKIFNSKNYMALNVVYIGQPSKTKGTLTGFMEDPLSKEEISITGTTHTNNTYNNLQSQLYYKHNFSESQLIEAIGYYTFSKSGSDAFRNEISEWNPYELKMDFDNKSHNGGLEIDYTLSFNNVGTLNAGSKTDYSKILIDDLLDEFPVYDYREFKEYVYVGLNNNSLQHKFNYNLSLGSNIVAIDADGSKNTYVDFVPSVSLGYRLSPVHYISFRYYRNRTMPTPGQLNPRNTSTDEFTIRVGNPELKPSHMDVFNLGYIFTKNKWRISPYLQYYHVSDQITATGSLDDDIYTSTYKNCNHLDGYQGGVTINYNASFGFLGGTLGYIKTSIPGMSFDGNAITANINGNLWYKQFSMYFQVGYHPATYTYSSVSKTRNSLSSYLNFSWRINNHWSANVGAESFLFPSMRDKTWIKNGDYESYSTYLQKGVHPKITLGVSYSFSNKVKFNYRQKKYFNSRETGLNDIKAK